MANVGLVLSGNQHGSGNMDTLSFKRATNQEQDTNLNDLESPENHSLVDDSNFVNGSVTRDDLKETKKDAGESNGHANGYIDHVTTTSADLDEEKQPLIAGKAARKTMCNSTNMYIYLSHFLSAWGDNMWTFAVGVFLVEIDGDSLQLTATFGLTMGVSTLLLGPIIGDWVDHTPRLRAAQEALVLQNVMIAICAGFIYNFLEFTTEVEEWGVWAPIAHYVFIILLGTGAYLAHIANTITVERDWVVEICARDEDRLASMTATMRAIDLTAMIVAPIATGQIMTLTSSKVGALFIAGWNVASFFVEYYLLWKVYSSVPALQAEKEFQGESPADKDSLTSSQSVLVKSLGRPHTLITSTEVHKLANGKAETHQKGNNGDISVKKNQANRNNACTRRLQLLFSGVTIIIQGWKTYVRYEVMLSGLSLALLYMTVLGFDNVTIGYAKMQCLTESEVGLMMGAAGLVGTLGTFAYPALRRWLGLPWTGMVALTLQSATLSMCVVSVWLPGSPFDLDNSDGDGAVCQGNLNMTTTTDLTNGTTTSTTISVAVQDMTSVAVLMAGIIAARFGLWIADLTITQMFLETVIETERGIVNGVQQSLNQFLDLVKFALVIALPRQSQFGLLVILSYSFVFSGWVLYLIYLARVPRKLFAKKADNEV